MRVKSIASRKHKGIRQATKGFKNAARRRINAGKQAVMHAGQYAYVGRRLKKRDLRSLWIVRLSAAAKEEGTSYSRMIAALKKSNIELDRKVLSEIAIKDNPTFKKIISSLS
jgi:large subunit ribosomal protein L20